MRSLGALGLPGQPPALKLALAALCLQISAKDSFEIAFNAACGLVESGSLQEAEEQLQLAVRVGAWCQHCLERFASTGCMPGNALPR